MNRKWRIRSYVSFGTYRTGRRLWVVHPPYNPLKPTLGIPYTSWYEAMNYVNKTIKTENDEVTKLLLYKEFIRRQIITQDDARAILRDLKVN